MGDTGQAISETAQAVLTQCRARGIMLAVAESCTGGMIAAALTSVAGSSDVFDRGFVTYSNEAKTDMLGVPASLIATHGAVSAQVAQAMALGALKHSRAQASAAVTGIAGPGGGSAEKPVGTVFIAVALKEDVQVERCQFAGGRGEVREAAVQKTLQMLHVITSFPAE